MNQDSIQTSWSSKVFTLMFKTWAPVLYPAIFGLLGMAVDIFAVVALASFAVLPIVAVFLLTRKKWIQAAVVAMGFGAYILFQPMGYGLMGMA